MSKRIQLRRGTTAETKAFVGAVGEVTYDTTLNKLVVHNGVTLGGNYLLDEQEMITYAPIPYPKGTPPTGYLVMMGQSISQETYPILYSLYGATLPDLRGQFLRGLDYGKGIDVGRAVLSEQGDAIRNITGGLPLVSGLGNKRGNTGNSTQVVGAVQYKPYSTGHNAAISEGNSYTWDFDASRVVPVADENRPKNIAFLYIVKAG